MLSIAPVYSEAAVPAAEDVYKERPNILLIVADDLGYSDLGAWGGEINTPVLDSLASEGVRYTNFHVAATCSPTRAMLMTGIDHHRAGLGNMAVWMAPNQKGKPGYEGHLNNVVQALPERLRASGYHTYMAGKWHLGHQPDHWPAAHGFDRDLSLIGGAGSHFSDMSNLVPQRPKVTMTRNGKRIKDLPDDYFSSKNFTDFLIREIETGKADGRPFFAYLSLQVPHVPLQLPDDWIDRYADRYSDGYDRLRSQRLARQKAIGIVGDDVAAAPRNPRVPEWDSLSTDEQRRSARKMEIYAGIVENMDYHIGRILKFLRQTGEFDNTLIIFMSDNGAAAEDTATFVGDVLGSDARIWFDNTFDNRYENFGRQGSWIGYGPAWAQVSSVPFRLFNATLAEGGVRVPLFISGPGVRKNGEIDPALLHVTDLTQAITAVAGGQRMGALQGRLESRSLGMELFGQRALISGRWKLLDLPRKEEPGDWSLYDLISDPAEQFDLAPVRQPLVRHLAEQWERYARENKVVLPEGRTQPRPYE
jgi:arylsulfatase